MTIQMFIKKVEGYVFYRLVQIGVFNKMSDEWYLRMLYGRRMHKKLNLNNPITFNEKLQWLKLYDRNFMYTHMVDKADVKDYVAGQIGEKYIIPTLGVWDCFDDIDFDSLPNQFVLKCTHDSGGLVICRDKSKLDKEAVRKKIEKSLKRNYYFYGREWPYKNVKPRILAEEYMEDDSACNSKVKHNLNVYKIFNFNGEPKIIQSIQDDKTKNETIDYFDVDWNLLDLKQNFPNSKEPLPRPLQLEEMLELAAILSKGLCFLRTDFYVVNQKVLFSELTFYSDSGTARFDPPQWDYKLGSWLDLSPVSLSEVMKEKNENNENNPSCLD